MEIRFTSNLRVEDLPLLDGLLFSRALGLTDLSQRLLVADAVSREDKRESGREGGRDGAFILAFGGDLLWRVEDLPLDDGLFLFRALGLADLSACLSEAGAVSLEDERVPG